MENVDKYLAAIHRADYTTRAGRVEQFYGLVVESSGPDAFLGELCDVYSNGSHDAIIKAEVVGLRSGRLLLMPYGDWRGVSLGSEVVATGVTAQAPVGSALLGRVIDPFGNPLDDGPALTLDTHYPLYPAPINPLHRARVSQVLETGVRAIDSLLTIGRGQRVGIFSGSGVGKSTLLGMISRNTNADVNVIALVGERGREVRDFIEDVLGPEGLARSVLVVATADQPALSRTHAAFAATAIAEYFRDQGRDVLLMMDSVTRFAMAQREIGLAIGEPPTARGYTPSVFSLLPRMLERAGNHIKGGSITALYTVLTEGDDIHDPIADSVRAILDGHIILTRELANSGHFPSLDVLQSVSRLMPSLATKGDYQAAKKMLSYMHEFKQSKDMVQLGAYKPGANVFLDQALSLMPDFNRFLQQDRGESTPRRAALKQLNEILGKVS